MLLTCLQEAKFYLFAGVENVLEMLDLCTKFAEGVAFKGMSPPRGHSDAISLARFLTSKVCVAELFALTPAG